MPIDKIYSSCDTAVADIPDGAVIFIGGFGPPTGLPHNLIYALARQGAKNLTLVQVHMGHGIEQSKLIRPPDGFPDHGILFENHQVKKAISCLPALGNLPPTSPFEVQFNKGEVELEIVPQGTLVHRIRAGGAGMGGFYTRVGIGTVIEEGKEKRVINGQEYLLEFPLRADYALIRAHKADTMGNLVYHLAARTFNPIMATAADVTIVEAEHLVQPGELDPDHIHTPCLYVDRIVEIPQAGGKK